MPRPSYGATIDAIYQAGVQPERWSAALENVADYVGGTGGIIAFHDFRRNEGFLLVCRLREDLTDLYVREYGRNPYSVAITRRPSVVPVVGNTLVDKTAVRRSAYYADILEPQQIAEQVMQPHPSLTRSETTGGFAIMLNPTQADHAAAAAARMARFTPHLCRALDLSLEVTCHRDEVRRLGSLLEALPSAALLLDRNAGIIGTNGLADALLRKDDGIRAAPRSSLSASWPRQSARLLALLSEALKAADGGERPFRQSLRVDRPSGLPALLVIVTPLPPASFALADVIEPRARLLVQVIDPEDRVATNARMLRSAFDLTGAETRVAALIGSGLSAPHAAATLRLSPNTVRTHLKRTFEKTGVHSQVALARLMSAIAEQPSGSDGGFLPTESSLASFPSPNQ